MSESSTRYTTTYYLFFLNSPNGSGHRRVEQSRRAWLCTIWHGLISFLYISLLLELHTRPPPLPPWSAFTSSRSSLSLSLAVAVPALKRRCAQQMLPELKDLSCQGRRALQRQPGEPALYVLTPTHELGADAGGVEAARTLLQRGVRMNGERAELSAKFVRIEPPFVKGLLRHWDVPGVTTGGEEMDRDDEARKEVMRRAIVVIHGNMAGVTWVVVACLPRSCHFALPSRLRRSSRLSRGSRAPPVLFCNLAVPLRSASAREFHAIHSLSRAPELRRGATA
jgi:hypothetical protein